jgi:hypothetical protein
MLMIAYMFDQNWLTVVSCTLKFGFKQSLFEAFQNDEMEGKQIFSIILFNRALARFFVFCFLVYAGSGQARA